MTEGVIQGILRGNSLSHRLRRRQLPQRGSLGFLLSRFFCQGSASEKRNWSIRCPPNPPLKLIACGGVIPAPPIIQARPRRNKLHYMNPALRAGFTPFRLFLLSPRKPLRWVFAGAPVSPLLLLLFWTVHGPFSRFLLEEKEKMGGALHQPSSWL